MKLNKIALAVVAAATMPVVANAGVTVTPIMLGYLANGDSISSTADKQRDVLKTGKDLYVNANGVRMNDMPGTVTSNGGVALESGLYTGAGIGIELTPTIALELEYGESNVNAEASERSAKAGINRFDAKQKLMSGNFTIGTDTFTGYNPNTRLKPYVLIGAGQSRISVKNQEAYTTPTVVGVAQSAQVANVPAKTQVAQSTDTIGNLGLGAYYRINNALSLRGEARAIYNFDHKWWEGLATAGLNVVLGGHLAPAAPAVVEVAPVPVAPVVVVKDGDDDQDGVPNSIDQCPNTPLNVVVDARGCPVPVNVDDALRMELRVFFDNNKSVIKDQYKSEIQKVAEKMNEYPNSVAAIEGHASKTGPSARYNQRLSEARAVAVKSMLTNQFGIAPTRISTVGYGYDRPIAPNTTAEGRAMNRRVYAIITGNKSATVTQTKDMKVQ